MEIKSTMEKEKIVIFGTGSRADKVVTGCDYESIVCYIDNNRDKHGKLHNGKLIRSPEELKDMEYDRIIICSVAYKVIYKQLTQIHGISPQNISNFTYFMEKRLKEYYKNHEHNSDISAILNRIEQKGLQVFNYDFSDNYEYLDVDVEYDKAEGMFYVLHYGKRMYFKKSFIDRDSVIEYYRFLRQEQDERSPHRYLTEDMSVEEGYIVVDAGVAEGNFALEIIDKVSKIYLIEMDLEWIEALKVTFRDYEDKVVIIKKKLSDINDDENITLDHLLYNTNVDYIKIDIEGGEVKALEGAMEILRRDTKIRLNVCAYHNFDDEYNISKILDMYNINVCTSEGYMFFIIDDMFNHPEPRLVRGLVRGMRY